MTLFPAARFCCTISSHCHRPDIGPLRISFHFPSDCLPVRIRGVLVSVRIGFSKWKSINNSNGCARLRIHYCKNI